MAIRNFGEVDAMARSAGTRKSVAVVGANDANVLGALAEAGELVDAVLIGDPALIGEQLDKSGIDRDRYPIEPVSEGESPVLKAAELVRAGRADMLMKGKISTGELFKAILSEESGLRAGKIMSHLVLKEIPGAHKLLGITDGALSILPSCEDKRHILDNALRFYHALGYDCPNVAAICAVEKVSPKMKETVDAAELRAAWERGELSGCNFAGPVSYDIAVSPEVAARKGFDCPWSGDFDLMLVPGVAVGNILGKCLVYTAGAKMGSIVLGCRVPVIMGSRGATADDKYNSIALGVCCASMAHAV